MKKLLQFLVVAALVLSASVAMNIPANAETTQGCDISNTGPDSENECSVEDAYTCTVNEDNTVTILNNTTQESTTGSVTNSGNQGGGSATSGTVSNSNGTSFNVTIENDGCVAQPITPTPETPQPGKGETVQPAQKVTPKALPVTSGSALPVMVASLGSVLALAGVTSLYRRLNA